MDSTIKNGNLLQIGANELQAAEAAELAASDAFHASNLSVDRDAWQTAWNRLEEVRRLYQQGAALILAKGF